MTLWRRYLWSVLFGTLAAPTFGAPPATTQATIGPSPPVEAALASIHVWCSGFEPIIPAIFIVRRTGDTSRDLTVYYRLSGQAVEGEDYKFMSRRVVIPAGFSMATLYFDLIDDGVNELTEQVTVTILPDPGVAMKEAMQAKPSATQASAPTTQATQP